MLAYENKVFVRQLFWRSLFVAFSSSTSKATSIFACPGLITERAFTSTRIFKIHFLHNARGMSKFRRSFQCDHKIEKLSSVTEYSMSAQYKPRQLKVPWFTTKACYFLRTNNEPSWTTSFKTKVPRRRKLQPSSWAYMYTYSGAPLQNDSGLC